MDKGKKIFELERSHAFFSISRAFLFSFCVVKDLVLVLVFQEIFTFYSVII